MVTQVVITTYLDTLRQWAAQTLDTIAQIESELSRLQAELTDIAQRCNQVRAEAHRLDPPPPA